MRVEGSRLMPSRHLQDADPRLREAWADILHDYRQRHPEHDLILTATYRSPEEQQGLYATGRTAPGQIVTYCDGVQQPSKHNAYPSHALEFAVVIGGKVSWDSAEYAPVGMLGEAAGLVWGGSWVHFKDFPHLELPVMV